MKKILTGSLASLVLFVGTVASAQITNPIKYDTFSELVAAIINAAVYVLMPFVVLAFIYTGFLFVKAQGKPEEIDKAKSALWWSIVGAFILLGASAFSQIINSTISSIIK